MKIAKKRKFRYRTKTVYKRVKSSPMAGLAGLAIAALGYGAVRQKVSQALAPVTNRWFGTFGNYADEAAMTAVTFLVSRYTSGLPKKIAKAGLTIEMARLGEGLVLGGLNLGGGQQQTTNSGGLLF